MLSVLAAGGVITEDLIMGVTSIIFVVSLFTQYLKVIRTKSTGDLSYVLAFGNAFGLAVLCICMFSLGLYLSGGVLVLQGLLWFIIGMLKVKYDKAGVEQDDDIEGYCLNCKCEVKLVDIDEVPVISGGRYTHKGKCEKCGVPTQQEHKCCKK
jgi:uncharacterized protein with PQ loop repeat